MTAKNEPKPQEPLVGGRYLVKDGVRTLLEEPARDHPEGNRARDADGEPAARPPDETHFDRPAADQEAS